MEETTRAKAMAIVAKENERRAKKNAYLNAWRRKNRDRYNAYIRQWRAERKGRAAGLSEGTATAALGEKTIRRTTIDLDEEKLTRVRQLLGTRTLRETVDRSFDEVLARSAREASIARLRKMDGLDLDKPKVMATAWR